jgi:hypothetical protein
LQTAAGAWSTSLTSNVLRFREAQSVDVAKHDAHEEVRGAHNEDGADAHVQRERREIDALEQIAFVLLTLAAIFA